MDPWVTKIAILQNNFFVSWSLTDYGTNLPLPYGGTVNPLNSNKEFFFLCFSLESQWPISSSMFELFLLMVLFL